jgi:hypothetical protein
MPAAILVVPVSVATTAGALISALVATTLATTVATFLGQRGLPSRSRQIAADGDRYADKNCSDGDHRNAFTQQSGHGGRLLSKTFGCH